MGTLFCFGIGFHLGNFHASRRRLRDNTKKEFKSGLRGSGIEASTSDIEAIFSKFDADKSGALDYQV